MKRVKRLTALLMVLALLVTNLPLGALAMEDAPAAEPVQAAQESVEETTAPTTEETVAEATESVEVQTAEDLKQKMPTLQ